MIAQFLVRYEGGDSRLVLCNMSSLRTSLQGPLWYLYFESESRLPVKLGVE